MKIVGVRSILVAVVLLAAAVIAEAQQPKKVYRIGYLSPADTAAESNRSQGIRQALRELGYVEGKNIAFEHRYAQGDSGGGALRLKLAAELVRVKVDVIVVTGGPAWVNAAKRATQTIPIVIGAGGTDPIKAGLVESFPRPGGNVTGFTSLGPELGGKRLELLKEAVPEVARVAVIYDPGLGTLDSLVVKPVLPIAARALALTLEPWFARDADELQKVFAALSKERPDGLYANPSGPVMFANEKRIAEFALKSRIPSIYGRRDAVNAGGLMSYGADLEDSYRRVAYFIDRILKGTKPADLPVEGPTKFELVVNLGTAQEIGVTIPQSLLYRADRVIK